ncbi:MULTISPECIES: high affinity choline transporter 1 [Mycolicibacterium]|jgi:SSS family solute:Na+ symporter|uniref:Na+/solute symporter n=2 Tax=Mycolicibacterium TaxID=1866885 RepID=A1T3A3_MYCVP|nr:MULTISPECIES: sodium:solute symporter family protein [Mycolicibacterium]ABM11653.1 Na+/solute symporter [Mycolicibacterium vanbaalenii PYR-1]MCV7126272.1 sodium:solute symporter family protein [Mycolicibacterium vanbaalenii PYR-1]MDN4517511.1 sodium:solute symporter family protein [Mycolicibacterium austroafricanum]MDW5612983.1 sodium:solute symporter family protein [Mycolicibacterium sp. D5.8-2]QRZ07529.1 sodium:solute symporter family protein [Mycolicibacterium austroafricanum]
MILLGVAISIAVVVAVGFFVSRRIEGDSSNFLVGGRMLPFWLVGGALMGAAVDTNATLGNTDLAFGFGFWAGATLPLGLALCLTITGIFFAKPMNRMGLTSFPDYYRLRFGRSVEVGASLLLVVAFCMLVAGNLVAGGLLFNYFLGMPYWLGVVLIAAIAVAYTGTGGLIADAYTAIIQMALILAGAIGLFVWMSSTHGIDIAEGTGPFAFGQLSDPAQGAVINWATLIALGIGDVVAIDFMARVFSAKSPDAARKACFSAATGTVAICVPFGLVVLAAHSFMPAELDGPVLFVLLDQYAPAGLTVLVLCGLVGASMSTANGAILAISNVCVRNLGGVRRVHEPGKRDPLLRATRIAMVPMTLFSIAFAIYVKQTGILLTLAFDLLLACLAVPFILGLYWRRGTVKAAMAAMVVGFVVRVGLFVLTPTIYGVDNTILYIPNTLVGAAFDGWPTFIAFAAAILTYVSVSLATRPAHMRGLDIRVAQDIDDALDDPDAFEKEPELAKAT